MSLDSEGRRKSFTWERDTFRERLSRSPPRRAFRRNVLDLSRALTPALVHIPSKMSWIQFETRSVSKTAAQLCEIFPATCFSAVKTKDYHALVTDKLVCSSNRGNKQWEVCVAKDRRMYGILSSDIVACHGRVLACIISGGD